MRWLCFIIWSLAAAASAADLGIRVEARSPWSDPQGYTPVHISIQSPKAGSMRLRAEGRSVNASTTVTVTANQQVQVNLLLPPCPGDSYFYATLRWELVGITNGTADINRSGHDEDIRFILVNDTDNTNDLEQVIRSVSSGITNRVEPEYLPDRWQGYPDWTALIITPSGQAKLTDAQRKAIQQWFLTGGEIIVSTIGQQNIWRQLGVTTKVIPLSLPESDRNKYVPYLEKLAQSHNNHESFHGENSPVPGTENVPITLFVITALGFAIVVGPMNLWWVRRRGSRTLFLITTPLLSFATCVVLLVASLLADGVSTKRCAVQLAVLDLPTQQITTYTGASYFAAFATNQVELDHAAKLHRMPTEDPRYGYRRYDRERKNELDIRWEEAQKISGAIIPARENRQLGFTEVKPERRRVLIQRSGDGWQIRNGLGVNMSNFSWYDDEGQQWKCAEVVDGTIATLERGESKLKLPRANSGRNKLMALPVELRGRLPRAAHILYSDIVKMPHHFIAELTEPLDPIPGPSATDTIEPVVYITGVLQPAEVTP